MYLGQHRLLGPIGQEPPQGRAADLPGRGTQAAPRRAFTQEPAQRSKHAHRRAARMAWSAVPWWFARHDELRNQVQKPEVQHILPYPNLQIREAKTPMAAGPCNQR